MRQVILIAAGLVLAFTLVVPLGVAGPAVKCPTTGGVLRVGLARTPFGLDPHRDFGYTSSELQGNAYDTLVDYDARGRLIPSLAESWSQPEPTTYVFNLRRNVRFHDGSVFTAQDVLYTFRRIADPKTNAQRQKDLERYVRSIRAATPYQVEVRLNEPSATFLLMLAERDMYIVSKRWAEAGGDFNKATNGTGPYRLTTYEPNVRHILERFPEAWNPGCVDRIELITIPDDRARVNALKSGQIDFADLLPWQDLEFFTRSRDFRVYRGTEAFNIVRLNTSRPPLDNSKVRQALNFAVDRNAVNLVAFGGLGKPMDGFFLKPESWAYDATTSRVWKYDPDRARALLREAGVQPQDLRLTLESWSGTLHLDTAQAVQASLRALGITVNLRVIEAPQLYPKRVGGDYQMLTDGLSVPWADPDGYYDYFHSSGGAYAAAVKFRNQRLDELLVAGRQSTNREARKKIYADVERILFEEAPWIFVLWRPNAEVARSMVRGYLRLPSPLGPYTMGNFDTLWIEGK